MAKKRKIETRRIYYGEWKKDGEPAFWVVRIAPAKSSVVFDSTFAEAMSGHAGRSVGCHLSICAFNHGDVFPHGCLLPSFTKSTAIIVTKMNTRKSAKRYWDAEGVLYEHSHSFLVRLNDYDKAKAYLRIHPEIADRKIHLRPPRMVHGGGGGNGSHGDRTPRGAHVPRGALARAVMAGLIDKSMLTVLKEAPR